MEIKQVIQIIKGFRKGILAGNKPNGKCRMVCEPLYSYLLFLKVDIKLMIGDVDQKEDTITHLWLELPDGNIIDPTASQFIDPLTDKPMKEVYYGKLPAYYKNKEEFYKSIQND